MAAIVAALLVVALVPGVDAATTWTARFSGRGSASLRVGSPTKLVLGVTGLRAGSAWTVTLRKGSCSSAGTLILSVRLTASSTGRLSKTISLTATQTRAAASLPLALRIGKLCAPMLAPAPVAGVFTDGTWRVGPAPVVPGTYRAGGGSACYWARLSGFGGTLDEIIANDLGPGPAVVTIATEDAGFGTRGCGTWRRNAPAAPTLSPGDGTWRVGIDIAPGTYTATVPADGACYWARLSGFGGTIREIVANDLLTAGGAIVSVAPSDAGFTSRGCGTWLAANIGASPTPTPTPTACVPGVSTVLCMGQPVSFGVATLTVNSAVPWVGSASLQPTPGNVFVAVSLTLVSQPRAIVDLAASVRGPSGTTAYPLAGGRPPVFAVPEPPATMTTTTGWLTFEVPAGDAGRLLLDVNGTAIALY